MGLRKEGNEDITGDLIPLQQSVCPAFCHLHSVHCHVRLICYSTSLDKQEELKGKEGWQGQFNTLLDKFKTFGIGVN